MHSIFSFIFTRFRDIAAFVLQHVTFPIQPLVASKFLHFLWDYVDGLWAKKSINGLGLIDLAISFQDFQSMWS